MHHAVVHLALWAVIAALTCACAPATRQPADPKSLQNTAPWPPALEAVTLRRAAAEPTSVLDIGIVIFDTGLDSLGQVVGGTVFPEIRKAESIFFPVQLRRALLESGQWGVIRVLPRVSESSALQISGRIVHADGEDLVLAIKAVDASGRSWLDALYHDQARTADYPVADGAEPFGDIYNRIANDLLAARERLSQRDLQALPELALLRFSTVLAPEVFAPYLETDSNGLLVLRRLPADDDAMLRRIERLQRQEFLFVDTADEQYESLADTFRPTYNLWREYNLELLRYEDDFRERASDSEIRGRRGSFSVMQQTYTTFRRAKIQEQDLYDLAAGFDNEVTSTVIDVDDRVFRLNGSLDEQFVEWRGILLRIFSLENET